MSKILPEKTTVINQRQTPQKHSYQNATTAKKANMLSFKVVRSAVWVSVVIKILISFCESIFKVIVSKTMRVMFY